MECPVCKQLMTKVRKDTSYNRPDAKNNAYDRTVYQCETDDIWITTEVPKTDSVA